MPQDNPPLLDKTMNTTESTPRNLADVLASGLANIANNVKPDGSDISIDVPGMSANNVDDGFSELKQSFGNLKVKTLFNANSIDVDFGFVPSSSNGGQILLFNSNQGTVALITFGVNPGSVVVFGTKTYNVSVSGSVITITPNTILWGITTLLIDERHL